MERKEGNRERRVRRSAYRHGLGVRKSRARKYLHSNNRGGYMVLDERNIVVLGERFDASLDDIETFIASSF